MTDVGPFISTHSETASHSLVQRWDLLRALIARDIHLRYRGAFLGILWTLMNPLSELLVLLFVFGAVFRVGIANFPAYLFIGLIVYYWFQTSVNSAATAIVGNRELVRRPGVPIVLLPVVTVASNLVHFLVSLPILAALLIIGNVPVSSAVLALPLLIAIQFVLILGLSYPVATMHVWFRDTQHLLRIALYLLFYLTPVFYTVDSVPERMQWLYRVNPLAHMVTAYRNVLLYGVWPTSESLTFLVIVSTLTLIGGVIWFQRASARFPDEL